MDKIAEDLAGCWLDGAHGWHNTYRVIDIAVLFGFVVPEDMVKHINTFRESPEALGDDDYDAVLEVSDEATEHLQSLAPEGYVFEWDCGEFGLYEIDEDW